MGFRKDFVWGTATSAYQIEGAVHEGGKGLNVWDEFCHTPGRVRNGETADVSTDHYHRFREDIAIMKEMGCKAYRFSVSWARILPEGTGTVNEEGVQFYSDLIDALLEAGIEPYLTLYHWDTPSALERRGGWLNREMVEWFGEYAAVLSERFSDRVRYWITLNEPQCFIGLGNVVGEHAPGLKRMDAQSVLMAHHALMAHGRAVQQIRAHAVQDVQIGYAPTSSVCYPETDAPADIEAARSAYFAIPEGERWWWNVSWWSDPVMLGRYPADGMARFGQYLPQTLEQDLALISEPIDFYCQNIYNGWCARAGENGDPVEVPRYTGFPRTAANWPVTPEALYWGPRFLYERYGKPVLISENGMSGIDVVSVDGKVHDPERIDFVTRYLRELRRAADDGVDILGYLYWSLLDNFEWSDGYLQRFGLVYVDYRSQQRIPKDSAAWYRDVIVANGENL